MQHVLLAIMLLVSPFCLPAQTGHNINHALVGVATQSADDPNYPNATADRAIDGNRDGVWAHGSMSATLSMTQPWWQVALAGPQLVHEVVLFARADADSLFADTRVELRSNGTTIWSQMICTGGGVPIRGGLARVLMPPGGLTCDVVRVSRPTTNPGKVLLAELEAIEYAAVRPTNFARYGIAAQGSTNLGHVAARANDGNTDGYELNSSWSQTYWSDWWQVSLERKPYDEIRIWPAHIFGAGGQYQVELFDGASVVWSQYVGPVGITGPVTLLTSLAPPADRLRILRVSPYIAPLQLAEVEVFNYSGIDAYFTPFGIGCLGSAGTPVLDATSRPTLGSVLGTTVNNVPAPGIALMITGFSREVSGVLPLPFDLAAIGAPGCLVHTTLDYTQAGAAVGGVFTNTLTIPNTASLINQELHQQALLLDPAAGNAMGVTMSNAGRITLGL